MLYCSSSLSACERVLLQTYATLRTVKFACCNPVEKMNKVFPDRAIPHRTIPPAAQGATTIQRGVRFIWDRRATARRLRLEALVTLIQAAIRMFITRQRYTRRLSERGRLFACFKVTWGLAMVGRTEGQIRKKWKYVVRNTKGAGYLRPVFCAAPMLYSCDEGPQTHRRRKGF